MVVQTRALGTGNVLTAHQLGTSMDDAANGVAVSPDGSTAWVAGDTFGAFPGHVMPVDGLDATLLRVSL